MPHPADTNKEHDVETYLFEITIGDKKYSGDIPARSWEDAEACVEKFGGKVFGRSESIIEDGKICSICAGELVLSTTPKPIGDVDEDDFPDLLDD